MRPSFEEIYMKLAWLMSKRSTCHRLSVGSVMTTTDYRKVIAVGYNGTASGLPNGCESTEPGKCCCIHSEINLIINCDTPREVKKNIFITHLPCKMCFKSMINVGNVQQIFYDEDYRIKDSLDIAKQANINMTRFSLEKPIVF